MQMFQNFEGWKNNFLFIKFDLFSCLQKIILTATGRLNEAIFWFPRVQNPPVHKISEGFKIESPLEFENYTIRDSPDCSKNSS